MRAHGMSKTNLSRFLHTYRLVAFLSVATSAGQIAVAQDASDMADGVPWAMENPTGPSGEMVMFSDGTGRLKARGLSMRMTWTFESERLCITARFRGQQCASLVETPQGFRAERDGETVFTLSR